MIIELRNVRYNAALSEETAAFAADVWIDGRKEGSARNSGRGGMTLIDPHALQQRLDAHASTLPSESVDIGDGQSMAVQPNAEWLINAALSTWIARRDMKRALGKRILYTRTDKPGVYQTQTLTPVQKASFLASADIRTKWHVDRFLNDMPEDEAVRLYLATRSVADG